jgi:flagellar P-ring protein precursor FlgI
MNHRHRPVRRAGLLAGALALALAAGVGHVHAQEVRIRDLTVGRAEIPVRLVGYGLVVGLEGSGDRVVGRAGGGQTVRSVANLLRRFDVEVPEELLRTRNVAAVLVTAEVSPWLRPGGRFEVLVSSLGDATSLRGGMLWLTPMVTGPGQAPLATAQGALVLSGSDSPYPASDRAGVETTGRIPGGGVLEIGLPRADFGVDPALVLREPDLGTANRIADLVNETFGEGTARVEDPGSVALTVPPEEAGRTLMEIGELAVVPDRERRILIDSRDGLVVAGGQLTVGPAVVSHGGLTLAIGEGEASGAGGDVRVPAGTRVQDVASALHSVGTPPGSVAAIFESLEAVGAITARVMVR